MSTRITVRGAIVLTSELEEFIKRKIDHATVRIADDPTLLVSVEVKTTPGEQKSGEIFHADIHATGAFGDVYAQATRDTLHGAVDRASGEVRREINKKVGKHRDMIRRGAKKIKDFFRFS